MAFGGYRPLLAAVSSKRDEPRYIAEHGHHAGDSFLTTTTCPSCGTRETGKFCNNCGTALSDPRCPSCHTPIPVGRAYCHECGTRVAGGGGGLSRTSKPWIIAGGIAAVVALTAVVWATAARPARPVATVPSQLDLSMMSPQQQADSLFNRVMWAHQLGDYAEVQTFGPRALQAYQRLGALSNDARYHVGVLYSVAGPMEMALVHADSLEVVVPGHLFGAMLRGGVARVRGDTAALHSAYRAFLEHYDSEVESGRPEYADHATSVESFLTEARRGLGTVD